MSLPLHHTKPSRPWLRYCAAILFGVLIGSVLCDVEFARGTRIYVVDQIVAPSQPPVRPNRIFYPYKILGGTTATMVPNETSIQTMAATTTTPEPETSTTKATIIATTTKPKPKPTTKPKTTTTTATNTTTTT